MARKQEPGEVEGLELDELEGTVLSPDVFIEAIPYPDTPGPPPPPPAGPRTRPAATRGELLRALRGAGPAR